MIVATKFGGNREVRDVFSAVNTAPPSWASLHSSVGGERISLYGAAGLPALGAAIRLVSGMIASLHLGVYQGRRGDKKERPSVWQAGLFEEPCAGMSTFDWMWDIAVSLEATENALLQKIKTQRRVHELRPINMENVRIYQEQRTGEKKIEIAGKDYPTSDFIHIRGQTLGAGVVGVSRIWQHRDPTGAILAAQRFEGKFFQNDARPGVAFIFPEAVRREQAAEWKGDIEAEYGGVQNSWKPMVMGGGATVQPIPVSLRDAMFVEGRKLSVEDIGRIMDVHPLVLGANTDQAIDLQVALNHFLAVQLTPRLERIARALKADDDLFGSTPLYPAFEINDLSFVDPVRRAQINHQKIQDGTRLPDEIRADEGMPPLPPLPKDWTQAPGQVPQVTPVGGAPNPLAATGSTNGTGSKDTIAPVPL